MYKGSLSCIDSIDIHCIDGMVEKPSVSAFQNFLRIENRLNIKKVMGRNMWMCFVLRGERPLYTEKSRVFTPHSTLYRVLWKSHKHLCINSLDKHSIQCICMQEGSHCNSNFKSKRVLI